jgi:hypothetical protein
MTVPVVHSQIPNRITFLLFIQLHREIDPVVFFDLLSYNSSLAPQDSSSSPFSISSIHLAPSMRSQHNNSQLVHPHCHLDDDLTGTSSTSSSTVQSFGSQDSQVPLHKGLDMIENIFTTIFGSCCRGPVHHSERNLEARDRNRRNQKGQHFDPYKLETPQQRRPNVVGHVPQPPEIRRLALDDERAIAKLDRSGSLSFLFYQEEVQNGKAF